VLARDIMKTEVLVLHVDDSVQLAAEQLEEIHASGAPVVDDADRLVGVLTLSDIARSEHLEGEGMTARFATESAPLPPGATDDEEEDGFAKEGYSGALLGQIRVADWMTPKVTQVGPDATLDRICRVMLDEDIHRVFVVEGESLLGVISTKDVVRLLAAAPRERSSAKH
jgi:CBS domain-containing protein